MLTDGCSLYGRTLRCGSGHRSVRSVFLTRLKQSLPDLGAPILRFLQASILIRTLGRSGRSAGEGRKSADARRETQRSSPEKPQS